MSDFYDIVHMKVGYYDHYFLVGRINMQQNSNSSLLNLEAGSHNLVFYVERFLSNLKSFSWPFRKKINKKYDLYHVMRILHMGDGIRGYVI